MTVRSACGTYRSFDTGRFLARAFMQYGWDHYAPDPGIRRSSARNRLRGIITAITRDAVMAQVDIQAGPFRVVSLMSREAVDELGIDVGSVAVAVIKSTTVVVENSSPSGGTKRRTDT